jgi:endonuclease III
MTTIAPPADGPRAPKNTETRLSKKTETVQKLLKKISPRTPLPRPLKEGTLLEQGMLVVLLRHMGQDKAESVLSKLRKAYPDWNEMRVAQAQEIAARIVNGTRHATRDECAPWIAASRAAREWLQEVYQKTHGFDLEFMKDDAVAAGKLVTQMPFLGLPGGGYLLWLASGKQLPVHNALVRVLDRLGLISRTASAKKARDVIEPLVPEGEDLAFTTGFGEIADLWCLPTKPICWECVLVEDCPFGKKTFAEYKVSQATLEVQRQTEAARRAIIEKKEAAKRAREDARNAKKAAIEAAKQAREREKLARIEARRKDVELRAKKKVEAEQKRAQAAAALAARKAAAEARAKAAKDKGGKAKKPAKAAVARSSKAPAKPRAKDKRSGRKR